jgi:hypothetical protein
VLVVVVPVFVPVAKAHGVYPTPHSKDGQEQIIQGGTLGAVGTAGEML